MAKILPLQSQTLIVHMQYNRLQTNQKTCETEVTNSLITQNSPLAGGIINFLQAQFMEQGFGSYISITCSQYVWLRNADDLPLIFMQ